MHSSPWFPASLSPPSAPGTWLFCLPHAGGGAAIYHRWPRHLPQTIRVVPVKLPGRDNRHDEPAREVMGDLVAELATEMEPLVRQAPYAVFGHSMGAAVAFEVARRLTDHAGLPPIGLFVSACRAPRSPRPAEALHALPDDLMIQRLLERYGTLDSTTADEQALMAWMAPTLRADLKLVEQYEYEPGVRLRCPLVALGGAEDPEVPRQELEAWRHETTGRFSVRVFPGGHFYLREQESPLTQFLAQKISAL